MHAWVSGSPNRQLNSTTAGPRAVIARPTWQSKTRSPRPVRPQRAHDPADHPIDVVGQSRQRARRRPYRRVKSGVVLTDSLCVPCRKVEAGTTTVRSTTQNSDTFANQNSANTAPGLRAGQPRCARDTAAVRRHHSPPLPAASRVSGPPRPGHRQRPNPVQGRVQVRWAEVLMISVRRHTVAAAMTSFGECFGSLDASRVLPGPKQ